jgi:hypothetical protein
MPAAEPIRCPVCTMPPALPRALNGHLGQREGRAAERAFEIMFLDPGVRAYVFTFG